MHTLRFFHDLGAAACTLELMLRAIHVWAARYIRARTLYARIELTDQILHVACDGMAEVATSNSRRALGGGPIFNSGVLAFRRSQTSELFRRWVAVSRRVACGLRTRWTSRPAGTPGILDAESAWALATNDQFGLSTLVTPTAVIDPALASIRRRTLSSRFNFRGKLAPESPETNQTAPLPIIVRHDGRSKRETMGKAMLIARSRRSAMRWKLLSRYNRSHEKALVDWAAVSECGDLHAAA